MMNDEKLIVEFDVEKTIDREYGFQEKILKYKGIKTKYKGIVKDGKLISIVGHGFQLIPNEKVREIIGNYEEEVLEGWRGYWFVKGDNGLGGVLVRNSVDGTCALRCDVMKMYEDYCAILVGEKVKTIYNRHTKNLKIDELKDEIEEVKKAAEKYGEWLEKMETVKVKEVSHVLKILKDELPDIYTKGLDALLSGVSLNGEPSLKDVYEAIARRIWKSKALLVTKINYFRKLNDLAFVCCGM